jgi:hypothetical protein
MNKPIPLAAGWQQHLAIVITNASPKTVVSGEAEMFFRKAGLAAADNLVVARTERVGRLPAVARYMRDGSPRGLSADVTNAPAVEVGPGQSFTLDFSQVAEDALMEAIRKTGRVTKIAFATGLFYFGDNSRWFPGRFGCRARRPDNGRTLQLPSSLRIRTSRMRRSFAIRPVARRIKAAVGVGAGTLVRLYQFGFAALCSRQAKYQAAWTRKDPSRAGALYRVTRNGPASAGPFHCGLC